MFVVPLRTEAFIDGALRAAMASGYGGMLIVLARTAEARDQHFELTRDWTSIHDVTGPHIALLCPDPEGQEASSLIRGDDGRAVCTIGLHLAHPPNAPRRTFDQAYWNATHNRRVEEEFQFGASQAIRSAPAELHHAAWTEAVGRSATYFGIDEADIPAILLLSMWERRAVLVRLYQNTSIFDVCKLLARTTSPGTRSIAEIESKIENLKAESKAHRTELARARSSQARPINAFARWRNKINAIDAQLAKAEYLDPDLVRACRHDLQKMLETGEIGDLPTQLRILHKQVKHPLRHSDIWGLLTHVQSDLPQRIIFRSVEIDRLVSRQAVDEEDLRNVQIELERRRSSVQLADNTIIALYESGGFEVDNYPARAALDRWQVHIVRRVDRRFSGDDLD